MNIRLITTIATAGLVLAVAPPCLAGTMQQQKTTITIGVLHKSQGTWFTGKVTTPSAPAGESGRSVQLFARGTAIGNGNTTGSTRGHSPGYWQVQVSGFAGISLAAFSAYVFDRVYTSLSQPGLDSLPQSSVSVRYSDGRRVSAPSPIDVVQTRISILPVKTKSDGFWFTGAVTNRTSGAGLHDHLVSLFTHGRSIGQNISGTTRGHSAGYWQVRALGFAGISLSSFDAYAFDRFYPGLLVDEVPSQSPTIAFH